MLSANLFANLTLPENLSIQETNRLAGDIKSAKKLTCNANKIKNLKRAPIFSKCPFCLKLFCLKYGYIGKYDIKMDILILSV